MWGAQGPLPRLEICQAQASVRLTHGGGYYGAQEETTGLWAGRGDLGGVQRDPLTGFSVLLPRQLFHLSLLKGEFSSLILTSWHPYLFFNMADSLIPLFLIRNGALVLFF